MIALNTVTETTMLREMKNPCFKEPMIRTPLTKKLLFQLVEGSYLVSNTMVTAGQPSFAEEVTTMERREAQWQRVRAAGANGRLCDVFATVAEYHMSMRAQTYHSLSKN
jgi:hypothetical protein